MAKTTLTPNTLSLNEWGTIAFTSCGTDGAKIPAVNADFKRVILVNNTSSSAVTVTVKKGNGIQGVKDLDSFSVAASGIAAIRLDDGRYKNVSGTDKDYIIVTPSAATPMAVVELP